MKKWLSAWWEAQWEYGRVGFVPARRHAISGKVQVYNINREWSRRITGKFEMEK